ncbi:nucleotidyltransferase family protein [Thioalkalivibrio thiocyanoxidans]|uniref:nucleotidyltransferase family protein n=1 Tax=Thioalkalivibrio thiocyanoxidans TaxID=152475 RepID=UPI000360047A|nr:nucleotidyltransferase domain-containing protein [Thioalkalivibrio thiocyanoxidans]
MHPLIEQHRSALESVCRDFGVSRLDVFGSAARGEDFDPERSDVDFLVEFGPDQTRLSLDKFLGLRRELSDILGRPVDLVTPESVSNPYVLADIERTREAVHAA